jgi:hypothetical protein
MPRVPATGIKLGGPSTLGKLFKGVSGQIPGAVSEDYLHISTSVVTTPPKKYYTSARRAVQKTGC